MTLVKTERGQTKWGDIMLSKRGDSYFLVKGKPREILDKQKGYLKAHFVKLFDLSLLAEGNNDQEGTLKLSDQPRYTATNH